MSDALPSQDILVRLARIVGEAHVVTDPDVIAGHLVEPRGLYRGRALALLRPASTEETARVVALCNDLRVPVVPQGGNTGLVGGQTPDSSGRQVILSLRRRNGTDKMDGHTNETTAQ